MAERGDPHDELDGPDEEREDTEEAEKVAQPPERIPDPDPEAAEHGKRFMVASDAPLAVSLSEGEVASDYAPADLIVNLAQKVTRLLKDLGGGLTPMFYGAAPQHSMTLLFGDARQRDAQGQFPIENVLVNARRVSELIELEGDELYQRAVAIGAPIGRYIELAQVVQAASVTLRWQIRGEPPKGLDPDRARTQHARLTQEVPTIERPLTINGVLYRVIAEQRGDKMIGTIGVRLHSWSTIPPGYGKGGKVIAGYEKPEVEQAIREGLLNQPVAVKLMIRAPQPGTSFDPERRDLIVDGLELGPSEDDRLGPKLIDDDTDGEVV